MRLEIFHYGVVLFPNNVVAFIVLKEWQVLFLKKFCVNRRFLPIKSPIDWFDWWWGWWLWNRLNQHKSSFSLAHSFCPIQLVTFVMSIWTMISWAGHSTRTPRIKKLVDVLFKSLLLILNKRFRVLIETMAHMLLAVASLRVLTNAHLIR